MNNKQDFNGGFIIASKEAYDLLIKAGCKGSAMQPFINNDLYILLIDNNKISIVDKDFTWLTKSNKPFKQFYINNGALSWDEPKGEENDRSSTNDNIVMDSSSSITTERKSSNMDERVAKETISITDEDGKVYEFEKPEFECELFKIKNNCIYGLIEIDDKDFPTGWKLNGHIDFKSLGHSEDFDLTPIQKNIEVEKIVSYEFCGQGVVESREVVIIEQSYLDNLYCSEE